MDKSLTIGILIGASVSSTVGSAFKTLDQKFTSVGEKIQGIKMGQQLIEDIRQNSAALRMLSERADHSSAAKARLSGEIEKTRFKIAEAKTEARKFGIDISDLGKESIKLGIALKKAEVQLGAFQTRMQNRAVRQELKGQIMGAIGGIYTAQAVIKPSIDFESALADVRKVVDFTSAEEEKAFGKMLLEKSKIMPIAATGLAAISAAGGQLGVAKEKLMDFTDVVARMSTAFDMMPEEAGDSIAKLMNVYGLGITEVNRLGDVINQLGNTSAARERDIVNVLGRIGGTAKVFGLAGKEASALSAAFLSLGKPPEIAGTAINALLLKLKTADKQGTDFQNALASMGMSAKGLKQNIERDAQGALVNFLETLSKVKKSEQMGVMSDLFGAMYADDIALLVGGLDQYRQALKETADESRFAGAMQKEFENRAKTTANNIQLLKNNLSVVAINIGNTLLPALN
ncbi:MAG: phage tail tape measure protein [Nitrospirae bacterium]|nr:phage tail tape measure protein [Nitrospirota bacterium]